MTSQEIKAIVEPIRQFDCHGEATRQLLATYEIVYQLAVMNERQDVPKLKTNPFGLAHDETSKRDAVPGDCQFSSVRNPNPWLELYFTAQQVLIHRRNEDFRRLRAAVDALSKSVPSPSPEPAGQDSSPTSTKEYWDYMKTRDLMKKTDREQS